MKFAQFIKKIKNMENYNIIFKEPTLSGGFFYT